MSEIRITKKTGSDFTAISLGKARYFNQTDFKFTVNWGDGSKAFAVDNTLVNKTLQARTITYTVKVEDRSGDKFVLYDVHGDEVEGTLTFEEGNTYIFDQSDSSNTNHQIGISGNSSGSSGQITSGVTSEGTAGSAGARTTVTLVKGASESGQAYQNGLYLYCVAHGAGMGTEVGNIIADQATITFWHVYSDKLAKTIIIRGGFGTSKNVTGDELKFSFSTESERSPCSTHEDFKNIGAKALYIHGEGDFAGFSSLQKIEGTVRPLASLNPSVEVREKSDGDIRLNRTFAGTNFEKCPLIQTLLDKIAKQACTLKSLRGMFQDSKFNANLKYKSSTVTDMSFMFAGNTVFNQALGNLNTVSCTTFESMFDGATKFNQGLAKVSTDNIVSFKNMFKNNPSFNRNINPFFPKGGLSRTMEGMFDGATNFNNGGEKPGWKTGPTTSTKNLFRNCTAFQPEKLELNLRNCTDMEGMFENSKFNGSGLNTWNVQLVTNMKNMFKGSKFNKTISSWFQKSEGAITNLSGMFEESDFNQSLPWRTKNVTDFSFMFKNNKNFNQKDLLFNTKSATTIESMFEGSVMNCTGIPNWNLQSCISIKNVFKNCKTYKRPCNWFGEAAKAQNIENMSGAFADSNFNAGASVESWVTDNVKDMSFMFKGNEAFNANLRYWNVSQVTSMESMFEATKAFQGNLKTWNVVNVVSMKNMFKNSTWNGSQSDAKSIRRWFDGTNNKNTASFKIENMSGMFENSSANESRIGAWVQHKNTVTDISRMFAYNNTMNAGYVAKLFQGANNIDTVHSVFEGSFNIQSQKGEIKQWGFFSNATPEQKATQYNVLLKNPCRLKINGYDYTAQEDEDFIQEEITFDEPENRAGEKPGFDCRGEYNGRPPVADTINTVYFFIVDPSA